MERLKDDRCTTPKDGEVRWGSVEDASGHSYRGFRPYLVVSNETFNLTSGNSLCLPFTTKRYEKYSPVHVNFAAGSINGLYKNSTLMVENPIVIPNENLGNPVHLMSQEDMDRVARALSIQIPCLDHQTDIPASASVVN